MARPATTRDQAASPSSVMTNHAENMRQELDLLQASTKKALKKSWTENEDLHNENKALKARLKQLQDELALKNEIFLGDDEDDDSNPNDEESLLYPPFVTLHHIQTSKGDDEQSTGPRRRRMSGSSSVTTDAPRPRRRNSLGSYSVETSTAAAETIPKTRRANRRFSATSVSTKPKGGDSVLDPTKTSARSRLAGEEFASDLLQIRTLQKELDETKEKAALREKRLLQKVARYRQKMEEKKQMLEDQQKQLESYQEYIEELRAELQACKGDEKK